MIEQVVLLSGPISSGKSGLATDLKNNHPFRVVKTHDLIAQMVDVKATRTSFQQAGEKLDRETKGSWVADAVARLTISDPKITHLIIDAVRIKEQIDSLRRAYGSKVVHIHLTASEQILAARYAEKAKRRKGEFEELPSYEAVRKNKTERNIDSLRKFADVVINTDHCKSDDTFVRAASQLGLYGRTFQKNVDVLVGGQYGSEGKGQISAHLAPEYDYLVRVGGPNAGHKVWSDPEPVTFHQLPSGTATSARSELIVGAGAVIRVDVLLQEIAKFKVRAERLAVDPQAMIISDQDLKSELGLVESIGSTGQGVGFATSRKILGRSGTPKVTLARDDDRLKPYVKDTREILEKAYSQGKRIFLEGTQGTALSLHHGQYPFVTSRDTTVAGCLAEAGISPSRVRKTIVVFRTYPIRVQNPKGGTSGNLKQEIDFAVIAARSGIPLEELKSTEKTSTTKRDRRVGEFDWALLRRSCSLNCPTDIALSFADYIDIKNRDARRFEQLTEPTINFIEEIERVASAPVSLISTRFRHRSIIDRRIW